MNMDGEQAPVGWSARGGWLWWVLASTVGWAVGGAAGVALGGGLSRGIIVAGYVGVAMGVTAAGALQWLVLRRQVARAGWWVVTGIVGSAVVGVLVVVVGAVVSFVGSAIGGADWGPDWSADPSTDVGWVVGAGLLGTVLGVLQWLVLRRQVARAGWWVLASTVGWVVGGLVAGLVGATVGVDLSWAGLGAVYGAITGPVLVWLLRHRAAGAEDTTTAAP